MATVIAVGVEGAGCALLLLGAYLNYRMELRYWNRYWYNGAQTVTHERICEDEQ